MPTACTPATDPNVLDLAHAALPAPRRPSRQRSPPRQPISPRHLGGHGYDIRGLPELRSALADYYGAAGLPTTPEHILVTHGAQHGLALACGCSSAGDRVLVEHPTYPNALDAVRRAGGRLVPAAMDRERGWDVEMLEATFASPRHGWPTWSLTSRIRPGISCPRRYGSRSALLRRTRTPVVIDETLRELPLAGAPVPAVRGRRRIR